MRSFSCLLWQRLVHIVRAYRLVYVMPDTVITFCSCRLQPWCYDWSWMPPRRRFLAVHHPGKNINCLNTSSLLVMIRFATSAFMLTPTYPCRHITRRVSGCFAVLCQLRSIRQSHINGSTVAVGPLMKIDNNCLHPSDVTSAAIQSCVLLTMPATRVGVDRKNIGIFMRYDNGTAIFDAVQYIVP